MKNTRSKVLCAFAALLGVFFILACVAGFAACGGSSEDEHEHTWDAGVVTKEADCGNAGVTTYTCTECGETKTETIPATGNHTWGKGVETTPATETTDGVMTYTCTVCGATKTETIPATGTTTEPEEPAATLLATLSGKAKIDSGIEAVGQLDGDVTMMLYSDGNVSLSVDIYGTVTPYSATYTIDDSGNITLTIGSYTPDTGTVVYDTDGTTILAIELTSFTGVTQNVTFAADGYTPETGGDEGGDEPGGDVDPGTGTDPDPDPTPDPDPEEPDEPGEEEISRVVVPSEDFTFNNETFNGLSGLTEDFTGGSDGTQYTAGDITITETTDETTGAVSVVIDGIVANEMTDNQKVAFDASYASDTDTLRFYIAVEIAVQPGETVTLTTYTGKTQTVSNDTEDVMYDVWVIEVGSDGYSSDLSSAPSGKYGVMVMKDYFITFDVTDAESNETTYTVTFGDIFLPQQAWKCANDQHTVTSWTTAEPTCTVDGYRTGTCDYCGETVTEYTGETAIGHAVVGTYDSATQQWTYTCSGCDEEIELTADTPVASLTLEATDEASLRAAGLWGGVELEVTPVIDVATTTENNGTITVTSDNIRIGGGDTPMDMDIVLNADIDMTSYTIIVRCECVMDLNGHTISRGIDSTTSENYTSKSGVVQVGSSTTYGDLTLKDSAGTGKISGQYGVVINAATNDDNNVSTFTLVSGTVEGSSIAISTNGSSEFGAEFINIQGGTVSGGVAGIYLPSGSLTVSGGEISGMTGIEIKAGSASITGGTISTTVEDGQTSVNKDSGSVDTIGYAIAVINGSGEGAYKAITSVVITGGTLTGTVYVDASVDNVVTVCDGLDLAKDACDESGDVIADETAEGVEVDHYIYRAKTECEKNGHTATAYENVTYAVYCAERESWCALCEVCGEWVEIEGSDIYSFVLLTTDETSLDAAIKTAGEREDGSETNRTQILVYGTINISDDSYVLIDCDNVEIYGLGAEDSKIIDSAYEMNDHSSTARDGVEITGKNVTIRNLTIDGSKLNESENHYRYEHGLEILESAENVTLSNCVITGGTSENSSAVVLMGGSETGYLLIENCTLSGYHGITIEHDGSDLNVAISGGTIDGSYYGILIDAGSGVYLNAVNARINGKNSLTTNTTSAIFTNCTFGYNVYENKAYGSMGVYCDVTLKGCTFLSNDTECSEAYDGLVNTSGNYVIQAREPSNPPEDFSVTITLIGCKFVNTNEALDIGTLEVTSENFIYIVGSKSISCYLYFDDSDNAVKYAYDSSSHTITEYTGEEPGEGDDT